MLALQHDAGFIAASALGSFAVNAASFVFLAALALLAVRVRCGWALARGWPAMLMVGRGRRLRVGRTVAVPPTPGSPRG
jgi:hypothetical protein